MERKREATKPLTTLQWEVRVRTLGTEVGTSLADSLADRDLVTVLEIVKTDKSVAASPRTVKH